MTHDSPDSSRPKRDEASRRKKGFRRRRQGIAGLFGLREANPLAIVADETPTSRKPPVSENRKPEKSERPEGSKVGGGGGGFRGGSSSGRYSDAVKLLIAGLCALASIFVAVDGWRNAQDIFGGVTVGGVAVGGESREAAERALVSNTSRLPEEVTFRAGDESVVLDRDQLGIKVNTRESVDRAFAVGRDGSFAERVGQRLESSVGLADVEPEITYEEQAIRERFEVAPTEAGYLPVEGGGDALVNITPSEEGVRISDSFWENLDARIMQGDSEIEVPLEPVAPKLTTAEAENLKPTGLLSSFTTNYLTYDDDPGRITNLQVSSGAINGTMLAPGEVFSFNEIAEPLDYESSKVIVRGKVDTADGGGLCQVSSTLYVAVNLAGLEIVERSPHSAELPYIRPGLDATIWFGALDMKFRNTSPGYLYIQQWVDTTTGDVNAAIYGIPDGTEGTMDSERIARYKDSDKNIVTEWVTYRTVTKNGEVTESGLVYTDTYTSLETD